MSQLQQAVLALSKVPPKTKRRKPRKPLAPKVQVTTTTTTKPNPPPGNRKSRARKQQRRQNKRAAVLTKLADKSIALDDAQRLYNLAAKNAFEVRMPPMEHSRDNIQPIDARFSQTVESSGADPYYLYTLNPAYKHCLGRYSTTTSSGVFGAVVEYDCNSLTGITSNFKEARVGLAALKITFDITASTLPPKMYVGRFPSSGETVTATLTPDTLISYPGVHEVKSNIGYVAWTPVDHNNIQFNTTCLTTGALSADETVWILIYGFPTAANAARLHVYGAYQGEGLPGFGSTMLFTDPSEVSSRTASWDLGETMDKVSNFVWRASEAVRNVDPNIISAAGTFAQRYLTSRVPRLMQAVKHEAPPFCTLMSDKPIQWTAPEVKAIFSEPKKLQDLRARLSTRAFADLVIYHDKVFPDDTEGIVVDKPAEVSTTPIPTPSYFTFPGRRQPAPLHQ